MYIYMRNPTEFLKYKEVRVLNPEEPYEELTYGYMEKVENHDYKKDNFIVKLQIDRDSAFIHVLFLIKRVKDVGHEPPFREARDPNDLPLLILYDSPPSNLVMSASVAAVYRVLKPVYTAICSVVEYPATGTSNTM
jgi:hypothetical protein